MRKSCLVILMPLLFALPDAYGQSVSFLNSPADARLAALGNTGYVLLSPFAVQHNSAAITLEGKPSLGIGATFLKWQPKASDATLFNAAGYKAFNKWGITAGVRSNKFNEIIKTDDHGTPRGSFVPSELDLSLGLAFRVNTRISLGMSLRHLSSKLDDDAATSAIASDLSFLYHRDDLRLGLGVSNIGSKVDYGREKYTLPTRLKSGVAYQLLDKQPHALLATADLFYQITPGYSGLASGLGAEYSYNNLLAFRAGYHFEGKDVGPSYATVGGGLQFAGVSLDLAYMIAGSGNPMAQTLMFSLKWSN